MSDEPRTAGEVAANASLPEIHASELTPDRLTSAIARHGALIVRELIPHRDALELNRAFEQVMADAAADEAAGYDTVATEWYTPYEDGNDALSFTRAWVRTIDCVLMADSPAMMTQIAAIYRRSGILDLVSGHLGEVPVLSSQKSTLRRTLGSKVYTDNWHQDGAFLGPETRVINVWLALTPCGIDAASVEIGTTRQTGIVPTGGEGSLFDWSVSPAQAAKASPHSVTPICAPGDAVLFDHLCLHRTSISESYRQNRHALETWFFAPSTYPNEFDPRPMSI
jgi:ectoine hydroxylase-related dioxygenase (phytanoyl-CoA dioxygenase family)